MHPGLNVDSHRTLNQLSACRSSPSVPRSRSKAPNYEALLVDSVRICGTAVRDITIAQAARIVIRRHRCIDSPILPPALLVRLSALDQYYSSAPDCFKTKSSMSIHQDDVRSDGRFRGHARQLAMSRAHAHRLLASPLASTSFPICSTHRATCRWGSRRMRSQKVGDRIIRCVVGYARRHRVSREARPCAFQDCVEFGSSNGPKSA